MTTSDRERAQMAAYYAKNADRIKAQRKTQRAEARRLNGDQIKARAAEYREKNRAKLREQAAEYRKRPEIQVREVARSRERVREYSPTKQKEYSARYRRTHPFVYDPVKGAATNRAYRARMQGRTDEQVRIDQERLRPDGVKRCRHGEIRKLSEFPKNRGMADGLGVTCKDHQRSPSRAAISASLWGPIGVDPKLCFYCHRKATSTDHIVPMRLGGTDDASNMVPACKSCNSSKGSRPPLEWIAGRVLPAHPGWTEWFAAAGTVVPATQRFMQRAEMPQQATPTPDALSTRQVAEQLGVHEITVRRWITAGKLPASNVGTAQHARYRVRLADLPAVPTRDELRALGFPVGDRGPLHPDAVAEWERQQSLGVDDVA